MKWVVLAAVAGELHPTVCPRCICLELQLLVQLSCRATPGESRLWLCRSALLLAHEPLCLVLHMALHQQLSSLHVLEP